MDDEKKGKDQLVDIENLEISALDDKELESVSGGVFTNSNTATSCSCCTAGATG
jgi:bacteriocin-like protein